MGRTIIIGDVHGCLTELKKLLKKCEYTSRDRVILVGDIFGKGPSAADIIRYMRLNGIETILGNNDTPVISWYLARMTRRTLSPDLPRKHLEAAKRMSNADHMWLAGCPYYINLPKYNTVVVHAGVTETPVHEENPNVLTNLVYHGQTFDDPAVHTLSPLPPYKPLKGEKWARKWKGPKHVVFGHDARGGLQLEEFATGIDTACVYGGRLTALVFPGKKIVQVDALAVYHPIVGKLPNPTPLQIQWYADNAISSA